jgi:hypothetical protein
MLLLAAQVVVGSVVLALGALGALHVLKSNLHPFRTMISQYAIGRHGWLMFVCFAGFAMASLSLVVVLASGSSSLLLRVGLIFLAAAGIGLGVAALCPMDPVSTPRDQMSFRGRLHGFAFLGGVPCMLLAVLMLSLSLDVHPGHVLLIAITAVIWLSFASMIAIMVMVGPGKEPDPNGPERFLGGANRLFMVGYGLWLVTAAWPMLAAQT